MCCVVVFQPSIVFHIEKVIWFAPQIMPGLYMECYTEVKWVKKENPATLLKLTLFHECFSNCTNGTKSCNAPHIYYQRF